MRVVLRFLVPGLLTSLALAAVAALWSASRPDGGEGAGPGRASEFATEPADGVEIVRLRDAAKLRVVAQVMAGELDLFGAAAHFRQINHEPPELIQLGYRRLPGKTDEEKLCREVILWVKLRYPPETSHGEAMKAAARLETALAARGGVESATAEQNGDVQPTSGARRIGGGERVLPAPATPG